MDSMEHLLAFARDIEFRSLPASTVDRTKKAILDTLAVAIAGVNAPALAELTSLATDWAGRPEATLLTNGKRVPAPLAAQVNAVAARAWDLDDVHEQNTCHVNVSIIPAAFAVSEARGLFDGREFITAVALGSEILCRLSAAPRIAFSETGSIISTQGGTYAIALMAARMMKLQLDQMRHAVGLAHARTAGNQQSFLSGALAVRVMQGVAAESGIVAALMAEKGITGALDVLDGKFGYYKIFHRGEYEPADITRDLGKRFYLEEVSIKPMYPCCRFTHGPIDAMILAKNEVGIRHENIESISIVVNGNEAYNLCCEPAERKWNPLSVADAQFNIPYMTAYAAVHGKVGFDAISKNSIDNPAIRALLPKISIDRKMQHEHGRGTFPMPGELTVREYGGRITHRRAPLPKGHPENSMSWDDLADKFLQCVRFGRPELLYPERIIERVQNSEQLPDAGELLRLCVKR